ncbi:MAG TPA: ABC transporter permease [Candidatus Bathyarchaeia archaeon]|nr:ABC transporter permease [Candidatus Bathyarchaeia archaeon]
MDQQQDGSIEPGLPLRKILAIYFKASKKRVITMLVIGSIFFLMFSTIILVSFSLYQDSFYKYLETNHDWLNDNEISVISDGGIEDSESLASNFLMKGINEVEGKLDEIMPNVLKSSTGVLEIDLPNFISYNKYNQIYLSTFDDNSQNIIENNLFSGRLPENRTEILYYDALNQSLFDIGDILNLTGRIVYNNYPIITSCQVVGIINDLESVFYNNNLSTDILRRTNNYFITTSNYFYNLVNEIDNKQNSLKVSIDFDYTFTLQHLRTKKYLRELNEYSYSDDKSLVYLASSHNTDFCGDLISALNNFNMDWYLQIYNQLLICSPLILLIGFISIEIYQANNFAKKENYRLLKTHGLDNKLLSKFVLLENLILLGVSLVIGLIVSLIVAYIIVQSLGLSSDVSFFAGLSNFSSMFILLIIYFVFFIINYLIDLVQLRKTKATVLEQYKTKRRKFFSKIFSLPELNFLVPGLALTIPGLLVSFLAYNGDYDEIYYVVNFFIGFSIIADIGILFLLAAILLFLRRIMIYLWNRIGSSTWKNVKNYISLSMKHLSIYIGNYKNTIMVFFLIGLCVTPGFIMNKSVDYHNELEANLSIGCSDILVENWDIEGSIKANISKIDGIELSTVVSTIKLILEDSNVYDDSLYCIKFYVLTNVSEFVEVVNFTLLNQDGYSKTDISMLDSDLTYMMNRKYAQKHNYDKSAIFTTIGITPSVYQPKKLVYINDFSYFPLVPRKQFEAIFLYELFDQPTYIDLVVSEQTKDLILEYNQRDRIQKDYLLIKTSEGANITAIKEELTSNYQLIAYTLEDRLATMDNNLNSLGMKLFTIITIFSLVALVIYGCFKAMNIYKERQRLIEIFIQNGAKRRFIVRNFTLEFVLVIFVPIIIAIAISIPYLNNLSVLMLNLVTDYKDFTIWYPWWIFIGTWFLVLASVLIGWWASLTLFVKNFKSHKTE